MGQKFLGLGQRSWRGSNIFWCGSTFFGMGQKIFWCVSKCSWRGSNYLKNKFEAGRTFYSCLEYNLKVGYLKIAWKFEGFKL